MLSLQPSTTPKTLKPNLLPTKIHHNGPVTAQQRHWNPSSDNTAYLRGRKLRGRVVRLPENYEGVVLQKTDKILPQQKPQEEEEEDEEEEQPVEVKIMEEKGRFQEVVVWGHESVPGDEDVHVKGVEEWIGFAEAMHAYDEPATTTATATTAS